LQNEAILQYYIMRLFSLNNIIGGVMEIVTEAIIQHNNGTKFIRTITETDTYKSTRYIPANFFPSWASELEQKVGVLHLS
jgi:hypothetical protein